ncbi:MAG: 30S ribosomal protein S20 [Puniceicoccales bacterium]|jgi:ribosomal protein S20|nr:30S ribosomal protein S20 [Puniceicoccales bacterium]
MANKQASLKSSRQAVVHTERNIRVRSRLKTFAKTVASLVGGDAEVLRQAARRYVSAVDKAVKGGVVHANKSARCKSFMAQYIF